MTTAPDPLPPSLAASIASWCQARYAAENAPVPYSLTPEGEAALAGSREIEEAFAAAEENYGRKPGTADRLLAGYEIDGPEDAYELAAEVLDEWDSCDSAAYQGRLEAEGYGDGPEPEAEP